MRTQNILLALMLLVPVAAPAQEAAPSEESEEITEGLGLLERGARTLLRGLMGEVEPSMRDMAEALENWDFKGFTLDDLGRYHPPERLPNGDIIIRRKSPLDTPADGEIEI